jgi:hypothetical protein
VYYVNHRARGKASNKEGFRRMKEETREEIESIQDGIQDLTTWSIDNEKDADYVARELNNLIERIYNLDFSDDEE